jgi:hypothetical protein
MFRNADSTFFKMDDDFSCLPRRGLLHLARHAQSAHHIGQGCPLPPIAFAKLRKRLLESIASLGVQGLPSEPSEAVFFGISMLEVIADRGVQRRRARVVLQDDSRAGVISYDDPHDSLDVVV